jgi:hypothetical protein
LLNHKRPCASTQRKIVACAGIAESSMKSPSTGIKMSVGDVSVRPYLIGRGKSKDCASSTQPIRLAATVCQQENKESWMTQHVS